MSGRSTPFPYGADSQEEADAIARLGLPLVKAPDVGLVRASRNSGFIAGDQPVVVTDRNEIWLFDKWAGTGGCVA